MKFLFLTIALAMSAVGCATTSHTPASDKILIEQSKYTPVAFHNVRVHQLANGKSLVKGDLRRISKKPVRHGHIDYRLLKDGNILQQGKIAYGSAIKKRLTSRHSPFSIPLSHQWNPEKQQLRLRWDDQTHPSGE